MNWFEINHKPAITFLTKIASRQKLQSPTHDMQEKKKYCAHNLLKRAHDYYFIPLIC